MPHRPSSHVTYSVTLVTPSGEKTLPVGSDEHIWEAADRHGIKLPAICHQGRCLTCAGRMLAPGKFDQSDSVSYYAQDKDAGFVLLCTAFPRSELRILTHQQDAMRAHRRKLKLPAPYS